MTQDFYSISNYNISAGASQGSDYDIVNNVRRKGTSEKEQLKKLSIEFEAILVSKMFSQMDQSVDRENSLFGQSKYMENFKSILFNQIGRDVANSPSANIGFAKQLYAQMERSVSDIKPTENSIEG